MLLMNGASVTVADGEFADNRKSIHLHHSENVTVKDTTLVGMTSETRQLEATQHGKTLLCPDRRALIGIELDSFNHRRTEYGLTVENLHILGFSDMLCRENAFRVDPEVCARGHLECSTGFKTEAADLTQRGCLLPFRFAFNFCNKPDWMGGL
jgi:hypothetical protein